MSCDVLLPKSTLIVIGVFSNLQFLMEKCHFVYTSDHGNQVQLPVFSTAGTWAQAYRNWLFAINLQIVTLKCVTKLPKHWKYLNNYQTMVAILYLHNRRQSMRLGLAE